MVKYALLYENFSTLKAVIGKNNELGSSGVCTTFVTNGTYDLDIVGNYKVTETWCNASRESIDHAL